MSRNIIHRNRSFKIFQAILSPSEELNETRLTGPTHAGRPQRLQFEPRTRNRSLSGLKGSLVTKHSSNNLQRIGKIEIHNQV